MDVGSVLKRRERVGTGFTARLEWLLCKLCRIDWHSLTNGVT